MFQQPNGPTSVHHASEEELRCILKFHQQGPQMPETCREVAGETVMICSKDHTVKVFRYGHCGPISCHGPFEPPKPGAGCDLGRGQPQDARVRAGKNPEHGQAGHQRQNRASLGLNYTQEVELVTGTRLLSSSCFRHLSPNLKIGGDKRSCPVQH
uniref:(northern house mosquito) hypothetical protein n=1 Tax=Culex pipiens TaxID=7175 RepID=A0A8D8DFK6_CULPI